MSNNVTHTDVAKDCDHKSICCNDEVTIAVPIQGPFEVVTGLWKPEPGSTAGLVLGSNLGLDQCLLEPGQVVAVLEAAVVQTRSCRRCKCTDTDSWTAADCDKCRTCSKLQPGGTRTCGGCGAPPEFCEV